MKYKSLTTFELRDDSLSLNVNQVPDDCERNGGLLAYDVSTVIRKIGLTLDAGSLD